MSDLLRSKIREQNAEIAVAKRHFEMSETNLKSGFNALLRASDIGAEIADLALDDSLGNLPLCDVPTTNHRLHHRPGRPPKIERDPELKAFLLARVGRLSYPEMEADVKEHFPEARWVGKSTIHKWYSSQNQRD